MPAYPALAKARVYASPIPLAPAVNQHREVRPMRSCVDNTASDNSSLALHTAGIDVHISVDRAGIDVWSHITSMWPKGVD
jgi:hypothetical protein